MTGSIIANEGNACFYNGATTGQITHYLVATDFDFAIPAGATIDGIVVEWEKECSGTWIDEAVRIVKGASIGTTDKSSGSNSAHDGSQDHPHHFFTIHQGSVTARLRKRFLTFPHQP